MANLLPGRRESDPFPPLDRTDHVRIAARATPLARYRFETLARAAGPIFDALALDLAGELDELEATPSLSSAQAILSRIDEVRQDVASTFQGAPSVGGDGGDGGDVGDGGDDARQIEDGQWLWYRPGRSLETGEAEIASRGFFDVKDRPPLCLWVDARARPRPRGAEGFEVAVLFWVPMDVVARALAGCERCTSGALARYGELAQGDPPDVPDASSVLGSM